MAVNMPARIFVSNVTPEDITQAELKAKFERYGEVLDVYMGQTFAFVQFGSGAAAAAAIQGESGAMINNKKISCALAKKQPKRLRPQEESDQNNTGYGQGNFRERSPLRGGPGGYGPRPPPVSRELPRPNMDPRFGEPIPEPHERPRTPESVRAFERQRMFQQQELDHNKEYHLERVKCMEEERKIRQAIIELWKDYERLKAASQRKGNGPSAPRSRQEPTATSTPVSSPYTNASLTSTSPYQRPNHFTRGPW